MHEMLNDNGGEEGVLKSEARNVIISNNEQKTLISDKLLKRCSIRGRYEAKCFQTAAAADCVSIS